MVDILNRKVAYKQSQYDTIDRKMRTIVVLYMSQRPSALARLHMSALCLTNFFSEGCDISWINSYAIVSKISILIKNYLNYPLDRNRFILSMYSRLW